MKKFVAGLAGVFVAGAAMAAGTIRDNCGCGLGSMVLKDQEPTVLSQLAATFLNGICGNQTFGITFGTLECEPHAGIAQNKEVQQYIAANLDNLAVEMAQGEGATLDALADLMQVPAADRSALYTKLQTRFDAIFTGDQVTSTTVVQNLDKVLNG